VDPSSGLIKGAVLGGRRLDKRGSLRWEKAYKRGSLRWEKAYKRGEYSNLILVISHNHGKTIFVMKLRWISS
jgi:hypothetical protein